MRHRGKTPPFRTPTGEVARDSTAEIEYVRLGEIEQWVMIRGESVANPLLILVHGGPGFPEMRLFRHLNAALEKDIHYRVLGPAQSVSSVARLATGTLVSSGRPHA